MRTRAMWGAGLMATALAVTSCGAGEDDKASGTAENGLTVTAGLIGPETSAASVYWTELVRGFELARSAAETQYGVTYEIVERDDKGEPETGARLVQELLNEEQVDVIVGPSTSGVSLQAAPIIQRAGRPWLPSIPTADAIIDYSNDPNWAFRTNYNNAQNIATVGDIAFGDGQTVGMLYGTDGFGQAGYDAVQAYADDNGLELAAAEGVDPGAADMTSQLSRLKDAGADTVVMWFTTGADQATALRSMDQIGYDAEVVATATILDPAFTELAEPAQWDSMVFAAPIDFEAPQMQELVTRYEEEYGEKPLIITAVWASYASSLLYAAAVSEAGDPSDYAAVRDAMEGLDSIDVVGQTFDAPFAKDDHELIDPSGWLLYRYDEKGELVKVGQAGV